jgi:hypothetical protein
MIGFDRILYVLLAALVAMLPFELRLFPMLSNLQWLFIGVALIALPLIVRERKLLLQNKLVRAAFLFILTQWLATAYAPEFGSNAAKAAIRVTAGFILLCATLVLRERKHILHVWSVAAVVAAVYALLDYGGFGLSHFFRENDFYLGSVARLSGSFEYPNTAAAYFALSLPIIWSELKSRWFRIAGFLVVASALIMTYSRAASLAALLALVVWSFIGKKRSELQIAVSFGMLFLAFLIFNRDIYRRFSLQPQTTDFSAQYELEYNFIREHPNASGDLRIHLRNTGTTMWTPKRNDQFSLSYRLYDAEKKVLVRKAIEHTVLPTPVRSQEAVDILASFRAPDKAGVYLLTWDLFSEESGWFSGRGIYPGIVEVHVDPDNAPSSGQTDTSRWLQRDTAGLFVASLPYSRTELWKAAIDMTRKHPFLGVGPDNFRLLYGRQYGTTRWDTKIRTNNLYLELLSGSGLVGLAAFCVMLAVVRWKPNASSIGLAIFLIHGLLDTFLMTTPIYFAFWILLGQSENTTETS